MLNLAVRHSPPPPLKFFDPVQRGHADDKPAPVDLRRVY